MFSKIKNTFKNMFKNKELRIKLLITVGLLALYKIGTMIPLPTVGNLNAPLDSDWMTTLNYLSGSYLGTFTFLSLGLSPYITSSIVVQLLGMGVVPAFTRWKDEGEAGHKKTEKATFIVAVILGLIEAFLLTWSFDKNYYVLQNSSVFTYIITALMLFAGTLVTMLMARVITKKGIGNGSSLIIFSGIAARIGYDIYYTFGDIVKLGNGWKTGLLTSGLFALYILFFILIIGLIIFIDKSVKNIHIQYAKQSNQFSNQTSKIPVKVNIAGVIPVIFTVSILAGCSYLGAFTGWKIFSIVGNYSTITGLPVYLLLVMFFTTFYATEVFNAKTIAKNIKKSNAVVVGQLPGEQTEKFVDGIIRDMSIIGGIALCFIAALPIVISMCTTTSLNLSLGGTSMMILAGVACETVEEIKAKLNTVKSTSLKLFD